MHLHEKKPIDQAPFCMHTYYLEFVADHDLNLKQTLAMNRPKNMVSDPNKPVRGKAEGL